MADTYSPVPELNLLKEFDASVGVYYSESFELTEFGAGHGIDSWSRDPEFLDRFLVFGQANGSGSLYALWRVDDREDLATLPVVVFGDEGGVHLVSRSLQELYQLLALDRELYVDHEVVFFSGHEEDERDEEDGPSEAHGAYVAWLKRHFGLEPVVDPDAVLAATAKEFGPRFVSWAGRYVPDLAAE